MTTRGIRNMPSTWRDTLLPVVVFPTLAAIASMLLFGRLSEAGIDMGANCKSTPTFNPSQYTGIDAFDKAVCPVVDFFTALMHDTNGLAFLAYGLGISAPIILLPLFEAYRPGQSKFLKYPMAWILLSQVATVGLTMPLYWLTFILTGGAHKSRKPTATTYRQSEAEAIMFGIFMGAIVPSVAMLLLDDPFVTAIWQIYPVFVALAQAGHLLFRPAAQHSESGFTTLQVLFFACFLISSSVHISTVWPLANDLAALKTLLLPSIVPIPSSTDVSVHLLDFLKWDLTFAYLSTALATLWFAGNVKEFAAISLWYAFSIPTLGFGAAVAGIAIWRNNFL